VLSFWSSIGIKGSLFFSIGVWCCVPPLTRYVRLSGQPGLCHNEVLPFGKPFPPFFPHGEGGRCCPWALPRRADDHFSFPFCNIIQCLCRSSHDNYPPLSFPPSRYFLFFWGQKHSFVFPPRIWLLSSPQNAPKVLSQITLPLRFPPHPKGNSVFFCLFLY